MKNLNIKNNLIAASIYFVGVMIIIGLYWVRVGIMREGYENKINAIQRNYAMPYLQIKNGMEIYFDYDNNMYYMVCDGKIEQAGKYETDENGDITLNQSDHRIEYIKGYKD